MSIVQIITILGTIPLFSLRTFLPAFLTALLLAYPEYIPFIGEVPDVSEGTFLTKDWVIITLGVLSLMEIIGDKSTTIRNFIKTAETYLKPVIYLLINLSLIDETSSEVLDGVQWAAFNPLYLLLGFGTLATHWLAKLRKEFLTFLESIDEDDNLFIGAITSWVEDSLVVFGFLLLLWAGILMVVIYGILIAIFIYTRTRYEKKLENQNIACFNCGAKNLPFAVSCFKCNEPQPKIYAIGIFGQKKEELISGVRSHQLKLVSHKKCPNCGQKLHSINIDQTCSYCKTVLFQSPTTEEFIRNQDLKFYKITFLSFLLGFIPVAGFLISAVLANIKLFSPYRRYISKRSSFFTKLFLKFLTFLLFVMGIALGFIAAPVYIIMRYYIWKRRFVSQVSSVKT